MLNKRSKWESKNIIFVILLTVFLGQLINANINADNLIDKRGTFEEKLQD